MSIKKKVNPTFIILLAVVLLIAIPTSLYIFLKDEKEPLITQEERITEIKENLITLIPSKYEVIESEYEKPSEENDGCISLYSIYPKEYSEIEKEYLRNAELIYCEDINTAVLRGQVDGVRYNKTEGKWLYDEEDPLETKQYGENIVSIVELGGSHASSNFHIVRLDSSDELLILSIPSSNRIRCDTYDENGNEIWIEECVKFRDSLPPVYIDWVPQEIYEVYYNDLLEILGDI